ncbi:MAG: folylpolyglutamate synthase/dihydrofolate synthase family protein [Desulfocapsaceae bacterium]|nr:folylpolyglutamate synthase/dihydrofolate synthase family protein [Desulfocapsaceae bacterium]
MKFQEAWDYLDSLQQHKLKLGLEAMESFLDKVARPDRKIRCVHVAGTNGKGSVSINIVTMLAKAGYRVGLFTSPHLSSVRERFRINDQFISEEEFAHNATQVHQALGEEKITYFEFTTALALLWFAESAVDLVVLETGLGGRLDATNVVTPLVSVITNVSMDHEAYLGDTLSSIAFEKAGIIKKGVPLVTGVDDEVSREVVTQRCRQMEAPMYLFGSDFWVINDSSGGWSWHSSPQLDNRVCTDLRCGMKGDYQQANSSLAIAVLELLRGKGFHFTDEDIRQGLLGVHWPGRLEYLTLPGNKNDTAEGPEHQDDNIYRYIIDGAHNPAGVESLVRTLKKEYSYKRLIVVWGSMEDKDLRQTIVPVAEMASLLVLTKPQGERAAGPDMLVEVLPEKLQRICRLIAEPKEALRFAEAQAAADDLILIAGSLYLIGELRCNLVGELVDDERN